MWQLELWAQIWSVEWIGKKYGSIKRDEVQKFGGCERDSTFVLGEDTDNEGLNDAEEGGDTECRLTMSMRLSWIRFSVVLSLLLIRPRLDDSYCKIHKRGKHSYRCTNTIFSRV